VNDDYRWLVDGDSHTLRIAHTVNRHRIERGDRQRAVPSLWLCSQRRSVGAGSTRGAPNCVRVGDEAPRLFRQCALLRRSRPYAADLSPAANACAANRARRKGTQWSNTPTRSFRTKSIRQVNCVSTKGDRRNLVERSNRSLGI
jgi:hypothetical protein